MNTISLTAVSELAKTTGVARVPWAQDHAVTNDGRIFTCRPCQWRREEPLREMKQSTHQYGYKYARIYTAPKKCRSVMLHQLVAELFIGPCPVGKDRVLHDDGNPANNRVGNLKWGTQKENMEDMVRHGRSLRGLKNPQAKLNQNLVQAIRILHKEGYSLSAIGQFLSVSRETIRRAANSEHWK